MSRQPKCDCGIGDDSYLGRHADVCSLKKWAMRRGGLNERDIQRQIIDWLKLHRYFFWRQNVGGMAGKHNGKDWFVRFGYRGMPDIFVVRKARNGGWWRQCASGSFESIEAPEIIGIEVKRADGEQSQMQREFQTEFEKAGGRYCLARSLDDVVRFLR